MRALFGAVGLLIALAATPASAQQELTPEQLATVERFVGPPVDQMMDLCVSNVPADIAAVEVRWAEAGWPAFETDEGGERVSKLPPGDRQFLILALSDDPFIDSTMLGATLTCVLLTPTPFEGAMNAHLQARFGALDGVFHLQDGNLVEVPPEASPNTLAPFLEEVFAEQPAIVLLTGRDGRYSYARISVLHRKQ